MFRIQIVLFMTKMCRPTIYIVQHFGAISSWS